MSPLPSSTSPKSRRPPWPPREPRPGLLALGLLLAFACGREPHGSPPSAPRPLPGAMVREELAPGSVLVELRRGIELRQAPAGLAAAPGLRLGGVEATLIRPIFSRPPATAADDAGPIYLVQTRAFDEEMTRRDVRAIAADPRVRRAEPDRIRRAAGRTTNDPLFTRQWGLTRARFPDAWSLTTGSAEVIVAILDTGIARVSQSPTGDPLPAPRSHPDLEGRLLPGYDFITRIPSAGDGDGRDADPTDAGDVNTSRLHGTHVAGILGANANNRMGLTGTDWSCRILPVRVLGIRSGDGIDSDIADAVIWASGGEVSGVPPLPRPADVLNMSFAGPGVSFTLQRAITEALGRGVLIVAAAGNGGADATTFAPGAMDGVITIGAQDRQGRRAAYSNYGARVDLLAPGGGFDDLIEEGDLAGSLAEGILGTYRDDGDPEDSLPPFSYAPLIGTSQATPHVAGAAALAKAVFPGLRQEGLRTLLRATAFPSGLDICRRDLQGGCGAGLLDAAALVELASDQRGCGCAAGKVCLGRGGACIVPTDLHPSLFDRRVVEGGWCAVAPRGIGAKPGLPLLTALALLGLLCRRARRGGRIPGRATPPPMDLLR